MPKHVFIADAVNRSCSLNRGLVSWWMALPDQQRGNVFRDLCMRNHGTLTNGPTWGGALGRLGGWGSLACDGSDDYVQVSNCRFDSRCSFFAWVYPRESTTCAVLETTLSPGSGTADREIYIDGSGLWTCRIFDQDAGTNKTVTGSTAVGNAWRHVGFSCDGTNMTLYENGLQTGQTAAGSPFTGFGTASLVMGRTGAGLSDHGNLLIDSVRQYSVGVSPATAWGIFADEAAGYPQTLNWMRRAVVFDMGGGGGGATTFNYLTLLGVGA